MQLLLFTAQFSDKITRNCLLMVKEKKLLRTKLLDLSYVMHTLSRQPTIIMIREISNFVNFYIFFVA